MFNDEQNDAERVVFWVLGAVVTVLLATLLWWKLTSVAPSTANVAARSDVVMSGETGAATQAVEAPAPQPPVGDDLPKFLGELELGFAEATGLTLSGRVPTERKKDRLLSRAKMVFGEQRVVDQLVVDAAAPEMNWKGKTMDLMAKLVTLGPFKLWLKDNQVKLESSVKDDAAKAAWIGWLENFFVDQPLAVDAEAVSINESAIAGAENFDSGTLFNLAVNFASGSAEIPEDAKGVLEQAAVILREDGRMLRIVGHTDSTGDEVKNRALSTERADAVRMSLINQGVDANLMSSYGLGSDQPVADNDSEAGRAKNRRIEFKQ